MNESFLVSARKYRPSDFKSVVGQASITDTLKNAIKSNQIAQAFLFCGPRGVGKTTCARILAKVINCQDVTSDYEPCNKCDSCTSFNNSTAFNIFELDAASNNSVDDIRELVNQVRIPPQMGKYKVYIIDEVHMLSTQAFNAFLKTLEEPPAYAKFILATTEKHKIIPTILSRCQIFDFKRITVSQIASHLEYVSEMEKVTYEKEALQYIALKADGALRDALTMFDQMLIIGNRNITRELVVEHLNILDYDYYFKITDYIVQHKIAEVFEIFNTIIDKGFEGQHFIAGLSNHFRNLLMSQNPKSAELIETGENIIEKYKNQSANISINFIINSLEVLNQLDVDYKTFYNKRLSIEVGLMKLLKFAHPIIEKSISESAEINSVTKVPKQKSVEDKPKQVEVKENIVTEEKPIEVKETEPIKEAETTKEEEPIKEELSKNIEVKPKKIKENKIEVKPKVDFSDEKTEIVSNETVKESVPKSNFSFSLKEINKISEQVNEEDNKVILTENESLFSVDELEAAINDYIENNQKDSLLISAFCDFQPEIDNDTHIIFKLKNDILADRLNQEAVNWLPFIKNKLQNDKITFSYEVIKNSAIKSTVLTPAQKFENMKTKNPDLLDLIDKIHLELD